MIADHRRMTNWPELSIAGWQATYATLFLYTQIVGKIRLALTPKLNEWWNVPLYVTTRGLTTSPMPVGLGERTLSIDFDFIDHKVELRDSLGRSRAIELRPQPVCEFHAALFAELAALDVEVKIHPAPQECPITTPLDADREHASYDPAKVRDFFTALSQIEPVFQAFRAGFRGKNSPVHFFWGAFDLACSRYNGKPAPPRKGKVERDAYDEEVISLGFWPGDPWNASAEAMFYSYTVPEPAGLATAKVSDGAFWSEQLKEFLLPYDVVRRAPDPAKAILDFATSTYDAGSTLGGWKREALAYP
jgi:hypothetical protein